MANTYTIQFYDLLSRALGDATPERLQGFLDEVMTEKYNRLQIDGFDFAADMQLDFTYEQVQKEAKLHVMAQYVDVDAPAVPLGTEGISVSTGSIPRMKLVEYFNEDKIRKMMIMEQRFGADSDRVRNSAFDKLFNTVDTLIGGHTNSLTYQRHQMISAGGVTLTSTNNPRGLQNITYSASVPAANITTLTSTARWWTQVSDGVYSTPGSACNPVKDLRAIVTKAKNKGVRGHFEIDDAYADQVLGHPAIQTAIAAKLYPLASGDALTSAKALVAVMDNQEAFDALGKIVGAPFKIIDSIVSVEKVVDGKLSRPTFRSFESNVIVFVPDGSLGEILTVEPIALAGGTYGSFYEGRLLLTVDVDAVKKCQSFNTEMTSLVVPDKPHNMWYLHPYSAS